MQSCAACAEAWAEHQKLFALLDEWEAPEVSPFFDTRLNALVREAKAEEGRQTSGAFGWLRKSFFGMPAWRPIAAGALALAVATGVGLMQKQTNGTKTAIVAVNGTAVDDLQRLDKHQDEISNLELLDDLDAADMGIDANDEL
jgi:anti-sigma-K factor RskA